MPTNLITSIMQFVTPDLIAKIASALGLDRSIAQKAVSAAVPSILASLAGLASKPGGTQQLSSALAQQPNAIGDIIGAIGGAGQAARSEQGADMLSKLMGGGGLSALASAIGSYAGISSRKSETLLGLLGSLVMGALGQQQRNAGLDASGIASLLSSQKDQIAAALPSGFAGELRDSGFLDTLDSTFRRSAETGSTFARHATGVSDAAVAASRQAATSQGMTTWPYWIAALAVLAGLGWLFLGDRDAAQVAEQTPPATTARETVGLATPDRAVSELTGQLGKSLDGMRSALISITDREAAQAALPKLRQMATELDRINNAAARLPPEARSQVATQVAPIVPAFNQLCERVLAIPGVASIAKPLIDSMRTSLDTISRV